MKLSSIQVIILCFLGLIAIELKANVNQVQIGDTKISIEFKGHFTEQHKEKLNRWIEEMATAVAQIYGEFPLERARVKLVRSYSWFEPVPWGEVERWRGSRILLHVNPNFDYRRLRSDWTAVHEFSHLLLPYVGRSDSWFSEGLASYYQNIARGKAGLLTQQEAFQKLFNGFKRGERNAKRRPVPLSEASNYRRNNMRIYWSGAAYFLNVDLELQKTSNGKQSLGSVLKHYKACCLPNHKVTAISAVLEKLDTLSNTRIFTEEFLKIINSKQFPKYRNSFDYLGIDTNWNGVRLNQKQPYLSRRKNFFRAIN